MNIEKISKERRCMRCGLCGFICPVGALEMIYDDFTGFYTPHVNNKCIDCGKCFRCCPAENMPKSSDLIGEYHKIYLAHAGNGGVRFNATSGGVINTLVRYLIDKNIVECVLMTKYSETSPVKASPVIVNKSNAEDLLNNPRDYASRYVSVPVLSELNKIIKMKRIAVVGTPCQISALNILEKLYNIDIIKIGITCSGGMSNKATEQYKQMQHLPESKMYYRGDGWPGKNSLCHGETILKFPHQGSLFERMFSSQIFKNPGCRYCHDHFAEEADISFFDFWDKEEQKTETIGNSSVIVRSQELVDIIGKMAYEEQVVIVKELSLIETVNTQLSVLMAKKGNLHEKMQYKFFIKAIDLIFNYRLYRKFNIRIYQRICMYYDKLCRKAKLPQAVKVKQ